MITATVLACAVVVTGCASRGSHEPGSVYGLQPLPTEGQQISITIPYSYRSTEHLMDDATDVIVARVVSKQENVGETPGLESTDVTFTVDEVLAGGLQPGQHVVVYYLGGIERPLISPDVPTQPKAGLQYLLMLSMRPELGPTRFVTGPAQWVREFDDQRFAIDVHNPGFWLRDGSTVPLDVSIDEMKWELAQIGE